MKWGWMIVLLLSACAGSEPVPRPTPESIPTFPEREAVKYDTASEFVDDLAELGEECANYDPVGPGNETTLKDFATCDLKWGRLNVYILERPGDPGWQHLLTDFNGVQGPNWIALAPTDVRAAIVVQRALGGTLDVDAGSNLDTPNS